MNRTSTKRVLAVLAAAVMLTLASCGNGGEPPQTDAGEPASAPEAVGREDESQLQVSESELESLSTQSAQSDEQGGPGNGNAAGVVDTIVGAFSNASFSGDPVDDGDVQTILQSGNRAPSARNGQPWHFTVVTGDKVTGITNHAVEGNVIIVISGPDAEQEGVDVSFDCGLATQNMYLTAQALGYGARIYTSSAMVINQGKKDELELPEGYSAVAVLGIGHYADYADAVSSATTREPLDSMVNYVE